MAHLITFTTAKFDIAQERPNPFNAIFGQSVLKWLSEKLTAEGCKVTEPDTEDWGWYMYVEDRGVKYLVGASGELDSSMKETEWLVQIHKRRSLKEKLFGQNKINTDDKLFRLLETIVRNDKTITVTQIDLDA